MPAQPLPFGPTISPHVVTRMLENCQFLGFEYSVRATNRGLCPGTQRREERHYNRGESQGSPIEPHLPLEAVGARRICRARTVSLFSCYPSTDASVLPWWQ